MPTLMPPLQSLTIPMPKKSQCQSLMSMLTLMLTLILILISVPMSALISALMSALTSTLISASIPVLIPVPMPPLISMPAQKESQCTNAKAKKKLIDVIAKVKAYATTTKPMSMSMLP